MSNGFNRTLAPDTFVVQSDTTDIIRDERIQFDGNVIIFQKQQTVQAEHATFDEATGQFLAQGNVELTSNTATVFGESIFIDEKNKNFELINADYRFGFNAGRGTAQSFSIENSNELSLDLATFTTCPGNQPSWLFSSSEINIKQEEGWGEAWNTVFKVGDVPVLYVPYITFPLTDVRKSGLLFPEFGSSSRYGAYYAQPIYFNLATNYDLTLTPKYMSQRGWLFESNMRHLSDASENTIQLEYLDNDQRYPELDERYLAFVQHESLLNENWNLQVQWTELSDDNYISEFNSDYHHQADTHLNNFAFLRYTTSSTQLNIFTQDMVELGQHDPSYRIPLQLDLDWNALDTDYGVGINLRSSYTHFKNSFKEENNVERLHIEPAISYSYYEPSFQFESTLSYLATRYDQEFKNSSTNKTIDRGVGKFRLLTGLNFEKQTTFFNQNVRQTLEPKLQYVYVEASEQDGIGLYDSQKLKEDYFALFRDQSYSSVDRIDAMDQVTVGVSTSIFNEQNQELFRFGIGQVHKLSRDNDFSGTNEEEVDSKPSLAIEVFGQLSENWQVDGGLLYNRDDDKVETGFLALDYWIDENKNIQINQRYARDVADVTINQSGLFGSYKLNDNWSVAASYHYDSERDLDLDGLIGFEYRSCCWSIQVSAQRQVVLDLNNPDFNVNSNVDYENGISINFTLSGLGGDSASKISKMFSNSIFAYRRPYLITK
ncbi:LPS assembly protein LptD [Psychrosphaera sp.]|nr:LPS assembly protein LptD [Psychrosphaera sp.]